MSVCATVALVVGATAPGAQAARSSVAAATYLGGTGTDAAQGVAVDARGDVYVVGTTSSANFPVKDALQAIYGGAGSNDNGDVFVAKLTDGGTRLLYATYLGGGDDEYAGGIAADAEGNAYVVGYTRSPNFPTMGAVQRFLGGQSDGFLAKIDASGQLVYSTYFGGSGPDGAVSVAVDATGSAYVVGSTGSMDFPTTPGAIQQTWVGYGSCAYVAKFSPDGATVEYASLVGGSTPSGGNLLCAGTAVAVDGAGCAYVAGYTDATDFATVNAFQAHLSPGGTDAFVAKLGADGRSLVYATYLGGSGGESTPAIAVDADGSVAVVGTTGSDDFPIVRPPLPVPGVGKSFRWDGFLARLSPAGDSLVYSTFIGGKGQDEALGVAVDAAGTTYVTGRTASKDFPTRRAPQASRRGKGDAFVVAIGANGAVAFASYLGGGSVDTGSSVAVVGDEQVYVAGWSQSDDFPVRKAVQATRTGLGPDAILARIRIGSAGG